MKALPVSLHSLFPNCRLMGPASASLLVFPTWKDCSAPRPLPPPPLKPQSKINWFSFKLPFLLFLTTVRKVIQQNLKKGLLPSLASMNAEPAFLCLTLASILENSLRDSRAETRSRAGVFECYAGTTKTSETSRAQACAQPVRNSGV